MAGGNQQFPEKPKNHLQVAERPVEVKEILKIVRSKVCFIKLKETFDQVNGIVET